MRPSPTNAEPARARMPVLAACAAILVSTSLALLTPSAPARPDTGLEVAARVAGEVGLLPRKRPDERIVSIGGPPREVGMRFRARVAGSAVGIRYFKKARRGGATPRLATLWSTSGDVLARTKIERTTRRGWQSVSFTSSVPLAAGRSYVVSVHTRRGGHALTRHGFDRARKNSSLTAPAGRNGVIRRSASPRFPRSAAAANTNFWVDVRFVPGTDSATPTPTPTPTPTASGPFPGPDNTGVPAGTVLTPYSGPCTITSPQTITAADVTATCGELLIHTRDVVIDKSLLPRVESTLGDGDTSVTITDSDVRAGRWSDGALWGYNITARRVDVTGAQHSFHCNDNCELTDSWLHDQYNPDGGSYHNNAFLSNGGTNMLVRHNTLHCTPLLNSTDGGCTSNVSLFGDFDPISHVTIDNNLLKANNSSISYCAYGGYSPSKPYAVATYIVFTNNVFERGPNRKCGVYGPVTSFQKTATGNVWSGNVWDSGGAVNP